MNTHVPGDKISELDVTSLEQHLNSHAYAVVKNVLSLEECGKLASAYSDENCFRNRVVMQSHGFGRGEYKYFAYPLPSMIEDLRTAIYLKLAPIANQWNTLMSMFFPFS
jgi:uncharacterized protein